MKYECFNHKILTACVFFKFNFDSISKIFNAYKFLSTCTHVQNLKVIIIIFIFSLDDQNKLNIDFQLYLNQKMFYL